MDNLNKISIIQGSNLYVVLFVIFICQQICLFSIQKVSVHDRFCFSYINPDTYKRNRFCPPPSCPTWFLKVPRGLNRAKAAPARNIREGASLPNQWEKRENMQPPNLLCQAWSIFFLLCKTWNGKKYVIQNVKTVLPFFMKIFIILTSDGIVYL